ncbi:MAG: hypothetical protein JNK09_11765 [Prolixibacteraceae bacterium]|nr:hypothetical protein [Prolixibacteraceae bacterium]
MKQALICLTFILSVLGLFAQDISESAKKVKKQIVSSEYDRNSLTIIGLKSASPLADQIARMIDTIKVSDKFYSNDIGFRNIPFDVTINLFDKNQQDKVFKTDVPQLLGNSKVGQGIVAKWFNRQPDGTFNTEVLKERGIYNSDDSDLSIASSTKRGESALMDAGLGLVDHSYVLVLGYSNLMTMDEYYNKTQAAPEARKMNGVKGDLIGLLYKLNFNDSVSSIFFQNMWANKGEANLQTKMDQFNSTTFPLIPVKNLIMPMQATQYNPGQPLSPKTQKTQDELLRDMVNGSMTNILNHLTYQVSDFKVKAQVYKTNPIAVKIGKKEGLGYDQRYFVFENRQTKSGDQYSQRIGVIKSMSVADNRTVTSGETEPSYFYQVAGGKIDNMGMFVEQRIDAGLNFFLGYQQDAMSGFDARIEYYMGRLFYGKKQGISKGMTSFKFYVDGGYNSGDFTLDGLTGEEKVDLLRVSVGVNKDYYLTHFLHAGPFVGLGIESATGKDSDYKAETIFIEGGARLGINLRYNIQLIGSATYYVMLAPTMKDATGTEVTDPGSYNDLFPDRAGLGISYGIRFMF